MENNNRSAKVSLPPIPAKRYFTIGEVSELCGVKPHVLRYWEQEFTQLKPVKRRGNRRYYQHHEVLLIRRIRRAPVRAGLHHQRRAQPPRRDDARSRQSRDKPDSQGPIGGTDFARIRREITVVLDYLSA